MRYMLKTYLNYLIGTIEALSFIAALVIPAALVLRFDNLWLLFLYIFTLPYTLMFVER